jgi:arsenate reductase (thioredoxin)
MNADHSNGYEAHSGGTEPAPVNPYAIRAMSEIGIDISHHTSKSVDQFLDQDLDYVVTVCDHANEACPFFPGGKNRLHKGFEDPAAVKGTDTEKLEAFRRIRDEIRDWIDHELVGFEV